MRTSLSHRCARFLDARDMLRRAFPFAHAQMLPICAGMAAGQDRPWDAGRLYACRDLIQEETGLFSNFRGAGHLAVITLLALSPAPEERMAFALQGYKVLRTRFYASQYLPLAALLLADWARGRDLDGVAARAEETMGTSLVVLSFCKKDGKSKGNPAPEKITWAFSAMEVRTMSAKLVRATMTFTPMMPDVFSRALRSSSFSPMIDA